MIRKKANPLQLNITAQPAGAPAQVRYKGYSLTYCSTHCYIYPMDQSSRETSNSFDQVTRQSSNNERRPTDSKAIPRTLPKDTVPDDVHATPKVDDKDRIWTDIDTLDDVKRMAREGNTGLTFPDNFEEDITRLRQMHANLMQHMKRQSTETPGNLEEQQKHINDIVDTIERYN